MYLIERFDNFLNGDLILEYLTAKEIYDKHYSDIDGQVFREIVMIDPTSIIDYSADGTGLDKVKKIGQYVKWMIRNYKQGKLKSEDIYKLRDYLNTYDMLKRKKLLDKFEIEKDINKFKTHQELFVAIEPYIEMDEDDEELMSNTELEKLVKDKESKKVFEDDKWVVVIPSTHRAACYYGKNTQWCTAAKDDESMFDEYNEEGDIYININKITNEKFQFHFEGTYNYPSPQFMNEKDEDINFSSFFLNNPTLREFYNEKCNLHEKLIDKLPDGVGIITENNINYMVFNEWSDFSVLFVDIDNENYVNNILSGDNEDFMGYGAEKYDGYGDVNKETLPKLIKFVQDYVKKENIELVEDTEYDLDDLANSKGLDDVYHFCNFNEITELYDAINHAYSNADEYATFSKAYNEFQDAIIDKFNLDKDVTYDEEKNHYKTTMDDALDVFNTSSENPVDIDYTTPYYGYSGSIDDDYLSEEVMYRLNEI